MPSRAHLAAIQGSGEERAELAPAAFESGSATLVLGGTKRIGTVLGDTYKIERLIATGGMGSVYEVQHQRLDQRFALKLLEHRSARNEESYTRFRQEAEIAASLNHRGIVHVFDFNSDERGNPYMVMEYVEGGTLGEYLGGRKLSAREALRVFEPLCHALDTAHKAGIVHRDLKPNNIMVRRLPAGGIEVKLLDFGISKMRDADDGMTRVGVVMGTPNYMSPEQAQGNASSVSIKTDIFALGAILYETLAGRRAFERGTPAQLLYAIVNEEPKPLREVRPDVSSALVKIVERCLAKEPAQRFSDVRQLLSALRSVARPTRHRVRAPVAPEVVKRPARGWFWAWLATTTAAVAGAGLLLGRPPPPTTEVIAAAEVRTAPKTTAQPPPAATVGYRVDLATPGAKMLAVEGRLYRADGRGLTFWHEPDGEPRSMPLPSASAVVAVATARGGDVLVGQADGTVSRWDRELREPVWKRRIGQHPVRALSAGSGYLALATGHDVSLINAQTGRSLRRFRGSEPAVALLLSPGPGRSLFIVRPREVEVIDVDKRRSLTRLELAGQAIRAALVRDHADGSIRLRIDFLQGDWIVRRKFLIAGRGDTLRLEHVDQQQL